MKSTGGIAFLALVAIGFTAFGWTRAQALRRAKVSAEQVFANSAVREPDKHKVTPVMLKEAESHSKSPAPAFHVVDADGVTQDLGELVRHGPLVLVFIKDGCPCSISAESYFNSLHALYEGRLRFLGVIDGDSRVARRWASSQGVPFPILPDKELKLAKQFNVTNSAFVALIDGDGVIDELWPGYSASMLQELNRRAANLAKLAPQTFETGDAPDELYSGCPFIEN